jgi:hypothetical protein
LQEVDVKRKKIKRALSGKNTPRNLLIQTQKDIAVIAESNRTQERMLDSVYKIVDNVRLIVEKLVPRVEAVEKTQKTCRINEIVGIYDKLKILIDGAHWLFCTKGGWVLLLVVLIAMGAVPDFVQRLIDLVIKKLIGG